MRKVTPIKPGAEFNCTVYLSDPGVALHVRGKLGEHTWRGDTLSFIINVHHVNHSIYRGHDNVIVFHGQNRTHYLTTLCIGNYGRGRLWIEFLGNVNVEFEEPECQWFSIDLDNLDELFNLPKPKMTGFSWSHSRVHRDTYCQVSYKSSYNSRLNDDLSYNNSNKLDILLSELEM